MENRPEILRLTNINKSFPGVKALTDMCFSLRKGEVHALVGENGAGKSTLMKILSGAYKKDSGTIEVDGNPVEIESPKHSERLGIAIIYQELNLIRRVSVAENVFLGRYPMKHGFVQWNQMNQAAKALFDSFGIEMDVNQQLRSLSLAQQQIVEIIKAVSINAKVVIMDEPTSSLTSRETEVLFRIIQSLRERGVAVIFITHRLDEIYAICDRMIGRELKRQYPLRDCQIGDVVFEAQHLDDGGHRVKDVSFVARAGEVLGFAGLVGAGRTETMRLIFGADPKVHGKILIDGQEVHIRNPRDAIAHRIGFVTENRKEEGLFLRMPVRVNITSVAYKKILAAGTFFNFRKERKLSEEFVQKLRIVTPSVNQRVMFLSGGNQQKVVLSKWLLSDSRIVIFDEPTRGIDVGAKREIYEIINALAGEGKVVIVVSSEMEEVMGITDRILVMHEGKISGEILKKDYSQNLITEYAIGGVG